MRFPAYQRYKPSGIEWLGDVPEHWDVARSDSMVSTSKRQLAPEVFAGQDVFHYSIPAVQEHGTGLVERGEEIASAKQIIERPVVLVSRLNPRKASICRAEPHGQLLTIASTEFVALRPTGVGLRYLEYFVLSEQYRQCLDSWVQSVTRSHQRVRPEHIYRFWSAWPGRDEQNVITELLDHETAKIDALVEKKRTLVERLKEMRTALITHTVARGLPPAAARAAGLNPNPKFRSSGAEWLGEMPEHWDVKRLKYISTTITKGTTPTTLGREFTSGGVNFVKVESISDHMTIDLKRCAFIDEDTDGLLRRSRLRLGDIVMGIAGAIGRIAIVGRDVLPANTNQAVGIVRLRTADVDPKWCAYALSSDPVQKFYALTAVQSAQANLSLVNVGSASLPFPCLREQQAISSFLDRETAKIDRMTATVETAIERLLEYRAALITAAVTGRIDVRGVAA